MEELQRATAQVGGPAHKTTISCSRPKTGLNGRVGRRKEVLSLQFVTSHVGNTANVENGQMRSNIELQLESKTLGGAMPSVKHQHTAGTLLWQVRVDGNIDGAQHTVNLLEAAIQQENDPKHLSRCTMLIEWISQGPDVNLKET